MPNTNTMKPTPTWIEEKIVALIDIIDNEYGTKEQRWELISQSLLQAGQRGKDSNKSTAWCECGDALETKTIMRKIKPTDFGKGLVTEIIDHYEYYCFGCDKTYKLSLSTPPKERETT